MHPSQASVLQGNVQTFIDQLSSRIPGLQGILVSDREGVVMLRGGSFAQDPRSEQMITTIFSICSEQTSKIERLGHTNYIISFFEGMLYLQANHLPLVITMVANPDVNTGLLVEVLPTVKKVLEDLRKAIANMLVTME
eukprot:GDKI01026482.1.p1 GENE.GDKI01026482.1~~GDKI01026482.1.p1  ORF type:complete len:162 (-),score=18.36 GDKI01026482.1:132-545(-)